MSRFLLKASFVVLIITFLLIPFNAAWALYEVENAQAVNASTSLTPQQPPDVSLQVEWDKPTNMVAGDSIMEYVYIWNHSDKILNHTELNQSTNDGVVLKDELLQASKNSSYFAGEDYDDPSWYFHIKTVYLSTTEGEKLGDDLYVGPFNFDDQAPEGTIALDTSVVGQTATTSSVNPVTLALTATPDTETVYLSNTTTQPQDGVAFASTLTHTVTEGVGQKTIYIWFKDQVGNTSAFSAVIPLTFDIIAGKSMDPAGDSTLQVNDTQTFTILGKGTTETFDWEIVDPDPAGVASFSGPFENVGSVDVVGDEQGTFKVKATSDLDSTVYESGTITVRGLTITHNYVAGLNLVPFTLTGTGITKASELDAAIIAANPGIAVSEIFGWDGDNQRYFSAPYANFGGGTFINNFDLVEGAAYFVRVDGVASLELTGTDYTSFSLYEGLNLLSVPYAKLATITQASQFDNELVIKTGLTVSEIFGWDGDNQRYFSAPYANFGGGVFINDFVLSIGDSGYFVRVSGAGNYVP